MTERAREQPALTPIADGLTDLQMTSRWQEHVYKQLHAHPELSFHETKTAAFAASRLRELTKRMQVRRSQTSCSMVQREHCSSRWPLFNKRLGFPHCNPDC